MRPISSKAAWVRLPLGGSPGRDGPFGPPPGQIPASGFPAPGSHLGSAESEALLRPRMHDLRSKQLVALLEALPLHDGLSASLAPA